MKRRGIEALYRRSNTSKPELGHKIYPTCFASCGDAGDPCPDDGVSPTSPWPRDNDFVERVWKSVKYEEVYLKAYANVPEGRASIGKYLDFYNARKSHQSLGRRTPDVAYFNALQPIPAAA